MELCDLNLDEYIRGHRRMQVEMRRHVPANLFVSKNCTLLDKMRNIWAIMIHIAQGLEFIHQNGQVHRDLKPRNILFSQSKHLWKIADFGASGVATSHQAHSTTFARGTASYRAPELLSSRQYTNKVDIWALGCILYELAFGNVAFEGDWETVTKSAQCPSLHLSIPMLPVVLQSHLQSTLDELLERDWIRRPSASSIRSIFLSHLRLLDPSVTQHLHELQHAPVYHVFKYFSQRFPTLHDFLYELANVEAGGRLTLPAIQCGSGETALHFACGKGNIDVVRLLLEAKCDVEKENGTGESALHWASREGNAEVVIILLDANADVNARDRDGVTPLHFAAWNGHAEIVEILLQANANLTLRKNNGATALHWAAREGHSEVVDILLNANSIQEMIDSESQGHTALHKAAIAGHSQIVQALIAAGCNVCAQTSTGETALHWAAGKGRKETVKLLLAAHCDPLLANENNEIPLHWAAMGGRSEIVQILLLANHESLNVENSLGQSALQRAIWGADAETVKTIVTALAHNTQHLLHRSVWLDEDTSLVVDLLDAGYDVSDTTSDGDTALHWAAARGNLDIVRILIAHNSDVCARNGMGETPLSFAARAGHDEVVQLLLGPETTAASLEDETPLHCAAWNGHFKVVNTLIRAGAGVSTPKINGATPLHFAAWRGHADIVRALLTEQSDPLARYLGGDTPLHRAATRRSAWQTMIQLIEATSDLCVRDDDGATVLHVAAQWGNVEAIDLLLASNIDVSTETTKGETPLHWAVRKGDNWMPSLFFSMPKGNKACVEALLKANINLRRQNEYGETALIIAAKDGGNELVKALMNATLTVSYQKSVQGTALHIAIVEGDAHATIREIQHEVGDIFFQNSDGETALHLVAKTGDAEMGKILFTAERQFREQKKSKLALAADRVDPRQGDWADDFYNPSLDTSFGRLDIGGRGGDRQMPTVTSLGSDNGSLIAEECTPVWSLQSKEV